MALPDPTGTDWTDQEIDLVVADYFDMLHLDLLREPYNKAQRNRAIQELTGRSHGSVEFKHQNISAVLQSIGRTWISGYKPRANFQNALINGIERYLVATQDTVVAEDDAVQALAAESDLFLEAPPSLAPPPSAGGGLHRSRALSANLIPPHAMRVTGSWGSVERKGFYALSMRASPTPGVVILRVASNGCRKRRVMAQGTISCRLTRWVENGCSR